MPIYVCLNCGKEFESKYFKYPQRRHCIECSISKMITNTTQLRAHSGPEYEKWKMAMKAAARKL